jgi:hypothetical protein
MVHYNGNRLKSQSDQERLVSSSNNSNNVIEVNRHHSLYVNHQWLEDEVTLNHDQI